MSRARTYHVSPVRLWLLWMVMGPMIALLVVMGATGAGAERSALLITAGLVLLITIPFHLLVRRTRLALSADGVHLRQAGYELAARWSDIEDVCLTPGREAFVTRESMAGRGAERLGRFRFVGAPGAPLYDAAQQQLLAERRLIPIEAFARHLREGKMRDDITRFAPHLAHRFGQAANDPGSQGQSPE